MGTHVGAVPHVTSHPWTWPQTCWPGVSVLLVGDASGRANRGQIGAKILRLGEKTYVGQDIHGEPGHRVPGGIVWPGEPRPSQLLAVLLVGPWRSSIPAGARQMDDGAAFLSLHSRGVGRPGIATSGCVQPLRGWSLEKGLGEIWGRFTSFPPFAEYRRVDAGAPGSLVPCHGCGGVT